ncbi:hypothetical protein C5167_024989 [Papaver somniferum]|uniref:Ubiquitin-activating enzyme SCCH domain-containing protein n=1 Tax=Papaver somniferum TaxID=3469 RepID=A0A4Y7JU84_PAPSO|nr:hypothetical protein C5167_024989 [Papaver somniferum]
MDPLHMVLNSSRIQPAQGPRFLSPPKRFRHLLEFSVDELNHLQFIMAASILRPETFGITIPGFPAKGRIISNLTRKVEDCCSMLPSGLRINPVQCEKDDDINYHMDLMAGLAIVRRITAFPKLTS